MNDIKVSVIIPVYNVEKYLNRCVDSVLSQTLKSIEVILVDDGSPDQSPAICDQYALNDSRVKVIHKKNGGLASARNAGLKIAQGDYIFFVDSDDWLDADGLESLYKCAIEHNVDFVRYRPMYANWPNHEDGSLCDFGTESILREGLYNRTMIIDQIYPVLISSPQLTLGPIVAAWRSLYDRRFIIDNNLFFDDKVRYSEDTIFSAKVIKHTNSFYYLDGPRYYHYFYNESSITKSFKEDRWDSCKNLIKCFEDEFDNDCDYDFKNQLYLQKIYCALNALGQRKLIENIRIREDYCKKIINDEITIQTLKHIDLVDVPMKLKIFLYLMKFHQYKIIARI